MEAAMNRNTRYIGTAWLALAALLGGAALAACDTSAPRPPGHTSLVHWPERQLLLVGDSGSGTLRVFRLVGDRPVPVALWRAAGRGCVLDIQVDAARRGIWVLGENTLDLHAANDGAILERRAASTARPALLQARDDS
jgi:hypothetical protein